MSYKFEGTDSKSRYYKEEVLRTSRAGSYSCTALSDAIQENIMGCIRSMLSVAKGMSCSLPLM